MKRLFLFFLLILTGVFAFCQTKWYVNNISTTSIPGNSWITASNDLQLTINTAAAGDTIFVAEGTYVPLYKAADTTITGGATTDRDKAFVLADSVKIYGGFPTNADDINHTTIYDRNWNAYPTILSGDIGNPNDSTDNCYHVIISSGNVGIACLDGFTITQGNANGSGSITVNSNSINRAYGGGIYTNRSSIVLQNIIIKKNTANTSGSGIYNIAHYTSPSSPVLTNVLIANNRTNASGGQGGGVNNSASSPVLTNVTIVNNKSNGGGSIVNTSTSSPKIRNSIIWGNTKTDGITPSDTIVGGNPTYFNCLISEATLTNGIILNIDPLFVDALNGDYRLTECSPAINRGDSSFYSTDSIPDISFSIADLGNNPRIVDKQIDLGVYEFQKLTAKPDMNGILHVNINQTSGDGLGNSWTNSINELSDALFAAKMDNNIKQIWVAEGTYKPLYNAADGNCKTNGGRDNAFVLVDSVKIYGGFPTNADDINHTTINDRDWNVYSTVLSGDIGNPNDSDDNCYHVVIASNIKDSTTTLDGFTITGGNANGNGNSIIVNSRTIIQEHGSGIYNDNSSLILKNTIFENNTAVSFGGGIYNGSSSPVLTNVTIANNNGGMGGGMFNNISVPVLTNTIINNNNGNIGGGICNMFTSYVTLTNVIISNNNGVSGGGIYNDDAYLVLTNTTVCYNSGGIGSGLFNINFASAIFRNCIVWDTSSNSIDTLMSITGYWNSLVKGVSALGVLDMDPLFADAANGNYRLTHSSPAVNTGNNAFYNPGNTPNLSHITTDLDGNPRIFNRTVDLGAYEFQSISDIIPDDSGIVYVNKHVTTGNGTGDSWYNAAIELADALSAAKLSNATKSDSIKQIWVAEASYFPLYHAADDSTGDGDRNNAFVLVKNVQVYGGFPDTANDNFNAPNATLSMEQARNTRNWAVHETILSGNIGRSDSIDNCYHVVISSGDVGKACLDGFTVIGGNADGGSSTDLLINGNTIQRDFGGGIMLFRSNPVLTHLKIHNNYADNGGGISNTYSSPIIANILIYNNKANYGGGIDNNASSPIFTNVTIVNNTANHGGGIYNSNTSSSQMRNSIIWGNNVEKTGASDTIYYSHTLLENANIGNGIILNGDPLFADAFSYDYQLRPNSPAINKGENTFYNPGNLPDLSYITVDLDKNTRILNGIIDLGAYETPVSIIPDTNGIVYVNKQLTTGNGSGKNWTNAAKEVGDALYAAKISNAVKPDSIKEIWIATETYYPLYKIAETTISGAATTDRDKSFLLVKDVQLYGGFPANADDVNNAPHAGLTKDAARNTRNWTINETILSGDVGNLNDSSDNCFHVVVSVGDVGNACLDGFTVIKGNSDQAGQIEINSLYISRLDGGGIYCHTSQPRLTNLIIEKNITTNAGGGIANVNNSYPILTNVIIRENTALSDGGGIFNALYSSSILTNVLINNNNTRISGGGIYITNTSSVILTNVTISNNIANDGGGIYGGLLSPETTRIRNSIIWGNTASTNSGINDFDQIIDYSIIEGTTANGTNLGGIDPLFVDTANDNYRLTCCSPAINVGNNAYFSPDSIPDISHIQTDLDGNPRFYNSGIIDLGAYELQQQPCTINSLLIINDTTICYGDTGIIEFTLLGSSAWKLVYTTDSIHYDTIQSNAQTYTWKVTPMDTTIYYFSVIDNNCNTVVSNDFINLNVIPTAIITNILINDTLCNGDTTKSIQFTGTGDYYQWQSTNRNTGFLSGLQTGDFGKYSLTNLTASPQTDTITVIPVSPSGSSCPAQNATFLITVLPDASIINIPDNDTLCHQSTTTPVRFTGNISNLQWEVSPSGDTIAGLPLGVQTGNFWDYTLTNNTNTPQTSIVEISSFFSFRTKICQGKDTNFSITILPNTFINNILNNDTFCHGETTAPVIFLGSFSDVQWQVSATRDTIIGLPLGIQTGDFGSYVLQNNNSTQTSIIEISPFSHLGTKSCQGKDTNFSITILPNAFVYSIPNNDTLCHGETVRIVIGGSNFEWEVSALGDMITGLPLGVQTIDSADYLLENIANISQTSIVEIRSLFSSGACSGKDTNFSITILPKPELTNIPVDYSLCSGNKTTAVPFIGTLVYQWEATGNVMNDLPTGIQTGNFGEYPLYNETNNFLTTTISFEPYYQLGTKKCIGYDSSFSITVAPNPIIDNIPAKSVLCSKEKTTPVAFDGIYTFYQWEATPTLDSIPAGSHNSNFEEYTLVNRTNLPVSTFVKITPYFISGTSNCPGKDTSFSITVNPEPTLDNTLSDQTLCDGDNTTFIPFSGIATQFDWTASGSISGMPSGTQTGNFGTYHLTNKTTYPHTSTILVTPKYSNEGRICSGPPQSFTVTVNPATSVESITPNSYILCEDEELIITVNGSGGNAYTWYHNGNLLRGEMKSQYIVSKAQVAHTGFYYVESENNCGESKSSSIYISIRSDSMLVEKWDDVILVDNSHYDFYGYQWYKDGILLPGAINQFYQELGGLKGCYKVELTLKDSSKLFSCERCLDKVPKSSFTAYPNPVKQRNPIQVLLHDNNEIYSKSIYITLYSSEGKLLESRQTSYGDFQVETSSLSAGIYILKVTTDDNNTYTEKIIIY